MNRRNFLKTLAAGFAALAGVAPAKPTVRVPQSVTGDFLPWRDFNEHSIRIIGMARVTGETKNVATMFAEKRSALIYNSIVIDVV